MNRGSSSSSGLHAHAEWAPALTALFGPLEWNEVLERPRSSRTGTSHQYRRYQLQQRRSRPCRAPTHVRPDSTRNISISKFLAESLVLVSKQGFRSRTLYPSAQGHSVQGCFVHTGTRTEVDHRRTKMRSWGMSSTHIIEPLYTR